MKSYAEKGFNIFNSTKLKNQTCLFKVMNIEILMLLKNIWPKMYLILSLELLTLVVQLLHL